MAVRTTVDGRRRSVAWVYYTVLAVIALVVGVTTAPAVLIGAALCGLYAFYLFRGGRFVLWIW